MIIDEDTMYINLHVVLTELKDFADFEIERIDRIDENLDLMYREVERIIKSLKLYEKDLVEFIE